MVDYNSFYTSAYQRAVAVGNTHCQAAAYAEWQLFTRLASEAPEGSYHAGQRAVHWLKQVSTLNVRAP